MVITAFQTSAYVAKCNGLFLKWGHETDFASTDDWLVTLSQKKKKRRTCIGRQMSLCGTFVSWKSKHWFVNRNTMPICSWLSDPLNESVVCCSGMHHVLWSMKDSFDLCYKLLKVGQIFRCQRCSYNHLIVCHMIYISCILDAVTSFMYILIYQEHQNIQSHYVTCES